MDIDKLLKLKNEFDRPRSVFEQLNEAANRSLFSNKAFDQLYGGVLRTVEARSALNSYQELLGMRSQAAIDNSLSNHWRTHVESLTESVSLRALRDPFLGLARESSFLAAQSKFDHQWKRTLADMTGTSLKSFTEISTDYFARIKSEFTPKLYSHVEREIAALQHAVGMVAEYPSASAIASLSATINETSLLTAARWMRGLDAEGGTIKRMFEPSIAYGNFSVRTLAKLIDPISDSRRAALAGSLFLADEQAMRTAGLLSSLSDTIRGESVFPRTPIIPLRPAINRYTVQRQELVEREAELPEEGAGYDSLVPFAPSAESFDVARRCLELIALCNETNETCTGETIFTLTSMLLISFSSLLGTVAHNRMTLGHVVESLYMALYESAGKDNLRYIKLGYVTLDECELIWTIKHLRNKWFSHDCDHGSPRDIREARRLRLEALNWLGIERIPTARQDYERVQQSLLERTEEFLSLLLTRVSGGGKLTN
jgi:hypothetical protein